MDCSSAATPIFSQHVNLNQNPSIALNFTSIYAIASTANILDTAGSGQVDNLSLQNCEIYGGGGLGPSLSPRTACTTCLTTCLCMIH